MRMCRIIPFIHKSRYPAALNTDHKRAEEHMAGARLQTTALDCLVYLQITCACVMAKTHVSSNACGSATQHMQTEGDASTMQPKSRSANTIHALHAQTTGQVIPLKNSEHQPTSPKASMLQYMPVVSVVSACTFLLLIAPGCTTSPLTVQQS